MRATREAARAVRYSGVRILRPDAVKGKASSRRTVLSYYSDANHRHRHDHRMMNCTGRTVSSCVTVRSPNVCLYLELYHYSTKTSLCDTSIITLNMSAPQQSFRSQLSGFRWANSVQDDSAPAAAAASSNPFSRAYSSISNSVSDYVPLRSSARSDEEEAYFALSVSRSVAALW